MNRQDFQVALGQADQLGNTLLQNRVMKQQRVERGEDNAMKERMFNEQVGARKEATKATADWRKETAKDSRIKTADRSRIQARL